MRTILCLAAMAFELVLAISPAEADQLYKLCVYSRTNPLPCPAGIDGKWALDAFDHDFGATPEQWTAKLGKRFCTYLSGGKSSIGPYNVSKLSQEGTGSGGTFVVAVHCITPPYKADD
jgi:hypothetical protein